MGHTSTVLEDLRLFSVPAGSEIADLGAQDFLLGTQAAADDLGASIRDFYGLEPLREVEAGASIPARRIFEHLGFGYTCFDVSGRTDAFYVDYNRLAFPRSQYGRFSAVLDAGTVEHVGSVLGLLFFMHHAVKPGGVMWHSVPVFGWGHHGLNCLTPKFWHLLAVYNDYEVLRARVVPTQADLAGQGNFFHESLCYIGGLREFRQRSATIHIVFRRRHHFCFVPPFDVDTTSPTWCVRDAKRLLHDALHPFVVCGSLKEEEVEAAAAWRYGF